MSIINFFPITNYIPVKRTQEFIENGTFVVPDGVRKIQVHLVGGGAGGKSNSTYEGGIGGGGGYTITNNNLTVTPNETLNIVVGSGGKAGGTTTTIKGSASTISRGNTILVQADGANGSNGGSGGGASYKWRYNGDVAETIRNATAGGIDGASISGGGTGQGSTTRDWGLTEGTLRSTGGAGGCCPHCSGSQG